MAAKGTGFDRWVKQKASTSLEFRRELRDARVQIDTVDDFVRAIDAARIETGLSKAELAREVGLLPEAVRRLLTAQAANPTLETMVKLADALGLQVQLTPKIKEPRRTSKKHAARLSA